MTAPFIESASDFHQFVKVGETTESLTLDFKRDLDGRTATDQKVRREAAKELARDIAQFANTSGGCLLVGIEEERVGAKRVAKAIRPPDDFDGRRQWIEQAVTNFLVPSTLSVGIVPIEVGGATIMAINVPAHEHLVWIWDRATHTMECVRRTNHGKEWLNPDETEEHLMNSSRAAKLAVDRVVAAVGKEDAEVDLASGVWDWRRAVQGAPYTKERVRRCRSYLSGRDEHALRLCIRFEEPNTAPVIVIPYGLVREAWVTTDGRIGLMLDVRLARDPDQGVVMEPF